MGNDRGTSHASSPVVRLGMEADQKGWITAEREFVADPVRVGAGRAWLRETLPAACLVRDESVLVLSELLANAAEHGHGGRVTATVEHGPGWVRGVLVEHDVRGGAEPLVQAEALVEMGRLLGVPVALTAGAGGLAERGRGLAVVASLCRGAFEIGWDGKRRVSRWELTGCVCEKSDMPRVEVSARPGHRSAGRAAWRTWLAWVRGWGSGSRSAGRPVRRTWLAGVRGWGLRSWSAGRSVRRTWLAWVRGWGSGHRSAGRPVRRAWLAWVRGWGLR